MPVHAHSHGPPVEELVPLAISMDGGQALDAGGDVGEEGRLRDVVQALELTDKDTRHHVQCNEEQHQRAHRHQEEGEDAADHAQAEEHQNHVLDEHFRLEGQSCVH